ncbi:MAG TPA: ATPase domain-containing protein, partial [Minicystis sp.]|nr:ATPase domain-containing protein [Minicystis sp.]
ELSAVVRAAGAVALFSADDAPALGLPRSRVEDAFLDGVILLSSTDDGLDRRRYLEVYKLRSAQHMTGRHSLVLGPTGVEIFPRYRSGAPQPARSLPRRRLSTGVPGLDDLLGGGLLERSVTLVSGSPGAGKTTLALHFLLAGAAAGEPGLMIVLEESAEQILANAEALGLDLRDAIERGLVEVLRVSKQEVRADQIPAVVGAQVAAHGTSRLAFDGLGHAGDARFAPWELAQLLYELAHQLKDLGVTSMFALESRSLDAFEAAIDDAGLSPAADNLLLLRYRDAGGALAATLTVVKARGTAHDHGHHAIGVERGGLRLADAPDRPVDESARRNS